MALSESTNDKDFLTVFEKACTELSTAQFNRWICFAYGILSKNMTKVQKEILLKAIEQDKKYV